MSDKEQKTMNILICGSKNFDDESFVFGTLDKFFELTMGNIGSIVTSKFAGACKFAQTWVEQKNSQLDANHKILLKLYLFDDHLEKKNTSLYEQLEIPKFVLQNDPFFNKGKELIQKENINLVMAFPNPEGILGASTHNTLRFAELSGAKVFDCSVLLNQINHQKQVEETSSEENGFSNKHPFKKK